MCDSAAIKFFLLLLPNSNKTTQIFDKNSKVFTLNRHGVSFMCPLIPRSSFQTVSSLILLYFPFPRVDNLT